MQRKFITFEGGEGSGKSTQVKMLAAAFEAAGLQFILTREPGGTPSAEKIRSLVVSGDHEAWHPLSETLLFQAARSEHISKKIAPALAEGKTVICDRFVDSTIVYQGIGKGLGVEYIRNLHRLVFGNFMPSLTIILDIEPEIGLKRAGARAGDETRFEGLSLDFHQQIRAGFLQIADAEKHRCILLNANQDAELLHKEIIGVIRERVGLFSK